METILWRDRVDAVHMYNSMGNVENIKANYVVTSNRLIIIENISFRCTFVAHATIRTYTIFYMRNNNTLFMRKACFKLTSEGKTIFLASLLVREDGHEYTEEHFQ